MAERFFCPDLRAHALIVLTGDEAHHLARVRRLEVGQRIELFDGTSDHAILATIQEISPKRVVARAETEVQPRERLAVDLTLGVAFPKGERLDWLIEKAVEVGVSTIQPILAARSVVDPRPAKLDRLRRHVIEASKQCGRNRLMRIEEPVRWETWVDKSDQPTRLLAHPGGTQLPQWPSWQMASRVALAIGPEGGFTEAEVEVAQLQNWTRVDLAPTILRIETAALVGSAMIINRARGETLS